MSESRDRRPHRESTSWFDPEVALYGAFGALVVGIGASALGQWALDSWESGDRLLPAIVGCVAGVAALSVLLLVRRRKRSSYVGYALVSVGMVCFVLAFAGFTLPQSWLR
jgi:uncharacterized membrane protein YeaQ/YmgE (transglycosylase-associated protein family)